MRKEMDSNRGSMDREYAVLLRTKVLLRLEAVDTVYTLAMYGPSRVHRVLPLTLGGHSTVMPWHDD